MLKNFKKIIATVAALAIASSSFVAMAATYPDVTPDASYYAAVEQLSALGMIAGFDDGTFKADEKVTRAQMAKLVVGAKNLLAAAESNTTQKFNDVPATHWAVGYVAEGVAQGIINGTSETTFDPEATVTFAQATKMLVNACGYEEYAQVAGGWPNGYLSWGTELGINKGVTGVSNDTELTRGQVAQMIANAIKAPILDIEKYTPVASGERVPEYKQMNGTGKDYQTLLTSEWDVYEVYGRVTGTQRNGGVDAGKIEYTVEKADNFDNAKYTGKDISDEDDEEAVYDVAEITAASNNSGAEDLYLEYTYALISKNDDDEYSIVYIESAGKNQYVAFNKNLVVPVAEPSEEAATELKLYKSETSNDPKTYELDSEVKLIVNGVAINDDTDLTEAALFDYLNASFENAYLINSPKDGASSTDKKYDYITLDSYETIVVEEVVTRANGKTRIIADDVNIDVDLENEDKTYSFVLTDGTELEVTDLQPNDVLSVQAEPGDLEGSDFYNVIVSRDTAEGVATAKGTDADDDTVYTVGDAQYKFNAAYADEELSLTKTYTLYLDKDGNITKYEILAESVNYAIVDRFFEASDELKVRLVLKDGSKVDYVVDDNDTDLNTTTLRGVQPLVDADDALVADVEDRFVEYTVNKSGEVTLKAIEDEKIASDELVTYNSRTSRIGDYGISDATIILNAATFAKDTKKSVSVTDKEKLIEDMEYTVVFLGEQNKTDGTYPMVVLLSDANGFTVNSQLQVAAGRVKTLTEDGQQVTAIPVMGEDGTVTDLILADDVIDRASAAVEGEDEEATTVFDEFDTEDIAEGVPFVAATNSAGEVTDIWVLVSAENLVDGDFYVDNAGTIVADQDKVEDGDQGITFKGVAAGKAVEFVVAPVVKKYAAGISLATTMGTTLVDLNDPHTETEEDDTECATSADAGNFFSYAAAAKAYTFDGSVNVKAGNRVALAESVAEVTQSQISRNGKIGNLINWDSDLNTPAFAVARVYGGDIQEIYSIVLD